MPAPPVSVTMPAVVVPSSQAMVAVCVSRKPGSANVARPAVSGMPKGTVRSGPASTAGATLRTVTGKLKR